MSEVQVQFLHDHIDKMDRELAGLARKLHASNLALHQIASASPCVSHPGTEQERSCMFCRTLIDVARDALGRERWPAESVRDDLLEKVIWEAHNLPMGTLEIAP